MKPEEMRARFHELTRAKEAIEAKARPLRAERERLMREHEAKVKALEAQYKTIEATLPEIDTERAALARALKGKTGEPTKG